MNILEYVQLERQQGLMEMIGVSEMVEGEFAKIRNEAAKEAEWNIISKLLVNHSLGEVSKLIGMESSEILAILQK